MPDKADSPALKALKYAETNLGVHAVYTEATTAHIALDTCLTSLAESREQKRLLEDLMEDSQMEIVADERSKHPEMSEAGMTRHLKLAYASDARLKQNRIHLRSLANEIEGLEYDRAILETGIKISVARMSELAGYLTYLAAIKNDTNI